MVDGVTEIPLPGRPLDSGAGPSRSQKTTATLRQFVAGTENHLAAVAVHWLLEDGADLYNPVLLYGPSGTGKSHLALGLAAAWKVRFRQGPVICATALEFARQFAEALRTKTAGDFTTRYRGASRLILENVEHLAGKQATQHALISTLDALVGAGSTAVLTAHNAPGRLAGITPALKSRLVAGLSVELAPPGRDARLVILQRLAALRSVRLSDAAADALAHGLKVTVPELFAAVVRLQRSAQAGGDTIGEKAARRYVALRNGSRQPSLRDIAGMTARQFSLTLRELRSRSRRHAVVTARAVAMYLARSLTTQSLNSIGRYFGCRDHTTVSYGCRKTEERLRSEPEIRHAVLEMQDRLATR